MMGAGIAYVCAQGGIEVVLKDVSPRRAEKGKALLAGRCSTRRCRAGSTTRTRPTRCSPASPRPTTTADARGLRPRRRGRLRGPGRSSTRSSPRSSRVVPPDALLGSNTSTLPITGLAEGVSRPADFIGLHFFSPGGQDAAARDHPGRADRRRGAGYRALDFAKQIKKTPIVVNDSRGFFTSRVIGTFVNEGIAMLGEGVAAASIEQAPSQAGYPAPGAAADGRAEHGAAGRSARRPREAIEADGRHLGRAPGVRGRRPDARGGPRRASCAAPASTTTTDGKRTGPVAGPARSSSAAPNHDDPASRTSRSGCSSPRRSRRSSASTRACIESVADANIGSIFGIGFPGWTGGVLQYINGYDGGVAGFVARARELARDATASASSRPPRSSRRPSAARSTATSRRRWRPDPAAAAARTDARPAPRRARRREHPRRDGRTVFRQGQPTSRRSSDGGHGGSSGSRTC